MLAGTKLEQSISDSYYYPTADMQGCSSAHHPVEWLVVSQGQSDPTKEFHQAAGGLGGGWLVQL